ncbi:MAG: hypothetical protein ACU836_06305 [Gammaproteobacteria bacterium]
MAKNLTYLTSIIAYCLIIPTANAESHCDSISNAGTPQSIYLTDPTTCGAIEAELESSGRFPDVFSDSNSLLHVCYASDPDHKLEFNYAGETVYIDSISAWTNSPGEINPYIGHVMTQMSFYHEGGNRPFARLFTKDAVVFSSNPNDPVGHELLTVTGGTRSFDGGKGYIALEEIATMVNNIPVPVAVSITGGSGTLCTTQ